MKQVALMLCFSFLSLLLSGVTQALTITNQAQVDYIESVSSLSANQTSNTVIADVQQVPGFSLASSQSKPSDPGNTVYFKHTLTNTGSSDSFSLQVAAASGNFAFSSLNLYADANNDGVPDDNTAISATGPLAANATFHFVVAAVVPAAAIAGQSSSLTVTANFSAGTPADEQTNTDTVTINGQAAVTVTKSLSVTSGPSPNTRGGSHILVTLTLHNGGSTAATNINITDVIGENNSIPAYNSSGMSYVAGSGRWNGQALGDAAGGDTAGIDYTATFSNPVTTINATLDSLAPGATTSLTFKIDIKPGSPAGTSSTNNAVLVDYFDGVTTQTVSSNLATYNVLTEPDLVLTKTHIGNFTVGINGQFLLTVRNLGDGPTNGLITVIDDLPAGLTYVQEGSGGTGWTCHAAGQAVTCTTPAILAPGAALPVLNINVTPTDVAQANSPVTNTAAVSGGSEPFDFTANNNASDVVVISAPAWVSGHVWTDSNHDNIFGPDEQPVPGMIVELLDANGNLLLTTVTDASGYYLLGPAVAGPGYQIRFRKAGGDMPIYSAPVDGEQGIPISQAIIANGIIQSITLVAGVTITQQSLPLDPSGVVYDAWTRLPLAGAIVTISGPAGFDPATNLVGGALNVSQTTTADGQYQFILNAGFPAGTYTLSVKPPTDYLSPSTLIPAQPTALTPPPGPGFYLVQQQATPPPVGSPTTYYLKFSLSGGEKEIANNHIPLDPVVIPGSGLLVEKTASVTTAEIGDFVDYTLVVKNTTVKDMTEITLSDTLPFGFAFQSGSSRLNGSPIPDPAGGAGPQLTFTVGDLAANSSMTITYRVQIGVNVTPGIKTNKVVVNSGSATSNPSSAAVNVTQGVFSDNGFIAGRVYMDCNGNRQQDADETGVPGVRLLLEDGTSVVTDADGEYSLYGISAHTHILKLDEVTLPSGMQLESLSNRNAGVASSRFIDLKKGELLRADFASASCAEPILKEVAKRARPDAVSDDESERMMKFRLNPDASQSQAADPRSLPSSGEVTSATPAQTPIAADSGFNSLAQDSVLDDSNSSLPPSPVAALPKVELESLLDKLDNQLDFIDLKDGDVLPMVQATVRVKGNAGSLFKLSVNGKEVSEHSVGKKVTLQDRNLEAWEYFGVTLEPGDNELTITMLDPFGNQRGSRTLHVVAPDQLAHVVLDMPEDIVADGKTPVKVVVRLVDSKDVAVTARTALTLEVGNGQWQVDDLNAKERGVQAFISGGRAEYELLPPSQPGPDLVRVSSGVIQAEQKIAWLPELRPLVAAGVIEGAINFRHLNAGSLVPADTRDSFDQEISRLSYGNADTTTAARAALFLKGKVKGDYLLTLSYDSDKSEQTTLFRDIQPDQYYPVYGDSAEKGFDAQSTGRLYVRVDKGRSYLLYGDFQTQSPSQQLSLSNYSRSLTGVKGHYESSKVDVSTFATKDDSTQVIEEFPANGTSGPFQLNTSGGTINSEKIEILTRDRNQPSLILKSVLQTRFTDYEIEQVTGNILFSRPVPSLDANLNPISIRVTYELAQGGETFWIGGANAQLKLSDDLEVGGVVVKDNNPKQPSRLVGLNMTGRLAEKTLLMGEIAQTRTAADGTGAAQRIELRHDGDNLQGRLFAGSSDTAFNNPSSVLNKGRQEAGGKGSYRLSDTTQVGAELVATKDRSTGAAHEGLLLKLEHALSSSTKVEVGTRDTIDSSVTPGVTPLHVITLRGKLSTRLERLPDVSVSAEVEQDTTDSSRKMAAVAGEYQLSGRGRLYARHEFLSSLTNAYALNGAQRTNTTVVGLDTDYTDNTHLFSEYRERGAIDGREAEAAVGLRNQWQLQPGLRVNLGLERVRSLAGAAGRNSESYTTGVDYTAKPDWKGAGRLEYNKTDTSESWLNTLDGAWKLSQSWSLLAKQVYSVTTNVGIGAGSRIQSRLLSGLAWRDLEKHKWDALGKYEHRRQTDTTSGADFWQVMDIVSINLNYQPQHDWQFTGHYAGKILDDHSLGLNSSSTTHLLSGRVMYDLSERWDGALLASVMHTQGASRGTRYGLGAELGYLMQANTWISLGYNFFGFDDPDQIGLNYTSQGIYVRLRYKFDQDLMVEAFDKKADAKR